MIKLLEWINGEYRISFIDSNTSMVGYRYQIVGFILDNDVYDVVYVCGINENSDFVSNYLFGAGYRKDSITNRWRLTDIKDDNKDKRSVKWHRLRLKTL